MRGCLQGIGCLVLIAALGLAGWVTRSRWIPRLGLDNHVSASAGSLPAVRWEPVTAEGGARARKAVERLGARTGPVFANLQPADLVSYLFEALSRELPPSARDVEATAIGDRLYVRASVKLSDFGADALGPLGGVLGEREPVRFSGTLDIVKPGLAEYRVRELQVKDLSIPPPMIPRLLRAANRGRRATGVAADALPLPMPAYLADVRIRDGTVTLYKTVP